MREEVRHLGQLAMATPLGQIPCDYLMLMLNVTDYISMIPNLIFRSGLKVDLVAKTWIVVIWTLTVDGVL